MPIFKTPTRRLMCHSIIIVALLACLLGRDVKAEAAEPAGLEHFATQVQTPTITLLDQHGNRHALQKLFADKVVVVSFVFTSCRSICPIITGVMKRVYSLLGEALGESLVLVSISVDPVRDTPETLAAFAKKLGEFPNWLWLTGHPADVAQTLKAFTIDPGAAPETHPPLVFVGKGRQWFKWVGLPDAQTVAQTALKLTQTTAP